MDTIWYMFNNLKSLVGNNSRFHLLFQVAKLILEQGTERNRLDIEGSLSSILAAKLDRPESKFACYNYQSDESLLVSAKKATRLYNEAHCSKSK